MDLDLVGCGERVTGLLRQLLFQRLGLCGALCKLRLRCVPVNVGAYCLGDADDFADEAAAEAAGHTYPPPSQDSCQVPGVLYLPAGSDRDLIRLVNPVNFDGEPEPPPHFLLDPGDLGRLRSLMAGFRHFRLSPAAAPGASQLRGAWVDFAAERLPADGGLYPTLPVSAQALLQAEVGGLQHLVNWSERPNGGRLCLPNFPAWTQALLPRYQALVATWG